MTTVAESVPREASTPRAAASTLEVPADGLSLPLASPTALSYFAAHPRRPQVYFGDYLLLQTLGEGEFGKVKLGVHRTYGEETAIKLIKREKVAAAEAEEHAEGSKMSKVEREIRVLKELRHPNIVHLYEVIESDRYIGMVLEYGAGGELFDYILAHKCLQERDACRLFAQLISGVSYLHRKKIIHRDLKLENLLLDRHRNVIITDFGFANDFSSRENDLMATSCGSPCYAAPELVVQDGLYVGAAVDVWSCGVILYAMLAGYLPFDDDPANPDGDNINMLYKYIMATPLSFPDYVGPEPRSLLLRMLVPDPTRRATLDEVMAHPWLAPYRDLFRFSVTELESAAIEQQAKKRQAYRDQMLYQQKLLEQQQAAALPTTASSQSLSADTLPASTTTSSLGDEVRPASATSTVDTVVNDRDVVPQTSSEPEASPAPAVHDEPVSQPETTAVWAPQLPRAETATELHAPPLPDVPLPPAPSLPYSATAPALSGGEAYPPLSETWMPNYLTSQPKRKNEAEDTPVRSSTAKTRAGSDAAARAKEAAMRRASPRADAKLAPALSYQATGVPMLAPVSSKREAPTAFGQEPLSLTSFLPQRLGDTRPRKASVGKAEPAPEVVASASKAEPEVPWKPMPEATAQGRAPAPKLPDPTLASDVPVPVAPKEPQPPIKERPRPISFPVAVEKEVPERRVPVSAPVAASGRMSLDTGVDRYVPPVHSAPRHSVWWRRLSGAPNEEDEAVHVRGASLDTSRARVEEERAEQQRLAQVRLEGRHRTWSGMPSLEARTAVEKRLSVHSGALDQNALTTRMPDELFMELLQLLQRMGIAVRPSRSEFRIECMRPRRLNALERLFSSHRLETSRRRWSRGGKHAPSAEVEQGLQRMSLSASSQSLEAFTASNVPPLYGDASMDGGHEVRFTVEISRLVRLQGLYSVDIRRIKGHVPSYKFLYDTVLERLDLGTRV